MATPIKVTRRLPDRSPKLPPAATKSPVFAIRRVTTPSYGALKRVYSRKASTRRVEIRTLDTACNPYLAFAVILGAGLQGVAKGYELGAPTEKTSS